MTVMAQQQAGTGGNRGTLYDVLELILDRGLVIDAFVRVSLVGIELLTIDVRVVVASVDTYLRFAEACNRLDLNANRQSTTLPEMVSGAQESGAKSKSKGALSGAAESISEGMQKATGRSGDEGEESKSRSRAKKES
ncbi:MAG: gas vesicle structural protein GvpA [Streptosporangiales bacterium]|nr:gas vesicle structural protein GvpA [Streptosporangiales bacterium]